MQFNVHATRYGPCTDTLCACLFFQHDQSQKIEYTFLRNRIEMGGEIFAILLNRPAVELFCCIVCNVHIFGYRFESISFAEQQNGTQIVKLYQQQQQ